MDLPSHDPVIPLLAIYPEEMKASVHTKSCLQMPIHTRMDKQVTELKRNEQVIHVTMDESEKIMMPSERVWAKEGHNAPFHLNKIL